MSADLSKMGSICIDKGFAQLIVTAFSKNTEYLRSVIPQLGPTCKIKVIEFICIVKVTKELEVSIEHVRFELTVEARNLLIRVNISAEPVLLTKEGAKATIQQVTQKIAAQEAVKKAAPEVAKRAAAEAAKTTLKSTAKTAFGCGALVEGIFLGYNTFYKISRKRKMEKYPKTNLANVHSVTQLVQHVLLLEVQLVL